MLKHYMKKNCKKQMKWGLGYKKVIKKKVINFMKKFSEKVIIISLIAGLIKKISSYKMSFYLESNSHIKKNEIRVRFV